MPLFRSSVEGSSGLVRCQFTDGYQKNKLLAVRGWQYRFPDRRFCLNLKNKEAEKMQHLLDDFKLVTIFSNRLSNSCFPSYDARRRIWRSH